MLVMYAWKTMINKRILCEKKNEEKTRDTHARLKKKR